VIVAASTKVATGPSTIIVVSRRFQAANISTAPSTRMCRKSDVAPSSISCTCGGKVWR
jgi:hypothetical protein